MLTEGDLQQIDIGIERKLNARFSEFEQKLDQKLDERFKKELNPIKSDIKKIQKSIDLIMNIFDRDLMHQKARVDRLEDHLHLPPLTH